MKQNCHVVGPIPVRFLSTSLLQIEEQGWCVRFVSFAGVVAIQESIIKTAGQQPSQEPGFAVVAFKESIEGEEVQPPAIKL